MVSLPFPTAVSLGLLIALAPAAVGQQDGPDPPVTGLTSERGVPVALSDGYLTRVDLYYPSDPPGPRGWPTIVFVHGLGGTARGVEQTCAKQAIRGYATIAFDVRGQGVGMSWNDPEQYGLGLYGIRERIDLAEVIEDAAARHPGLIDLDRLGVAGISQGAVYCFIAAAHSGRALPPNPWRDTPFPRFRAVAPENYTPDLLGSGLLEGRSISFRQVEKRFVETHHVHSAPGLVHTMRKLLALEDYAGLAGLMGDPELELTGLLETSAVPVLAAMSWDDTYLPVNALTEVWDRVCPTAPRRLHLSTDRHLSPANQVERWLRERRRHHWFDHFVKGVDRDVSEWPDLRAGITPEDPEEYRDLGSTWDFREASAWPPATQPESWYLAPHERLGRGRFLGHDPGQVLAHRVPAGYTILEYLEDVPPIEELARIIPFRALRYVSPPLAEDRLLLGAPQARLWVDCDQERYQVHVSLLDQAPDGSERFVTGGQTTIRGNLPPGRNRLDFPLDAQAYALRRGHRLVVQVENLAWMRPPVGPETSLLRVLPVFHDFDLRLLHELDSPSAIELPLAPSAPPRIALSAVSFSSGFVDELRIEVYGDGSREGWQYHLAVGSSGSFPGVSWNDIHLPLNFDELSQYVLNHEPELPIDGFHGRLDARGRASARVRGPMEIPPMPAGFSGLDLIVLIHSPDRQQIEVGGPARLPYE